MHMHVGQVREGDKGNQSHYSIKEHHKAVHTKQEEGEEEEQGVK